MRVWVCGGRDVVHVEVKSVCSGFCCISLVVHIGAQPVVPLAAKDSTEQLQR